MTSLSNQSLYLININCHKIIPNCEVKDNYIY